MTRQTQGAEAEGERLHGHQADRHGPPPHGNHGDAGRQNERDDGGAHVPSPAIHEPAPTSTTTPKAIAPHQCAGSPHTCPPVAAALIATRSVLCAGSAATSTTSTSSASPNTANVRSRAAPMSANPLPVSQLAAARAKRAS